MAFTDRDYKLLALWRNENLNVTAENSFGFHCTTVPSTGPIWGDIIQLWRDNVEDDYKILVSNNWFVESYKIQEMVTNTIVQEVGIGLSVSGGGTGDALPPQLSALISWRSGRTGRRGRGRTFLPPTAEGNNNSTGVLDGSYASLIDVFCGDYESFGSLVGDNDGVYVPAIMSKEDSSYHQILTHVTRNKWATQRGRTR